ncbi:hypothetical protein G1H11_16210 [Phytoactinopolyspora alkaliphila]|uniref:SAF domain-containing protein n=1 Tax=Phytoactinopolyspora alkaliphila TaxID=1783498 RepID=A0A6N9YP63_9ACTN|nr:hypothetical protein [Phytoactinopolyspora alkaliphila]
MAYVLAEQSSDAVDVIAVANDVPRGHVISEGDLTIASTGPDPALTPVPASRIDEIVGMRAVADLTRGTLLSDIAVTDQLIPGAGETVVGLAVAPGQLPDGLVTPGASVRVFDTPSPGDEPPKATPASIGATVVSIVYDDVTGQNLVNVLVDRSVAGDLVARNATGRIGVALDSSEDGGTS